MKMPHVPAIWARFTKWLTDILPAAAEGSSRESIYRHLLAGGLIVILLAFGVGGFPLCSGLCLPCLSTSGFPAGPPRIPADPS